MGSLELVDLVDANNKPIDGLVSVSESSSAESPHERAILEEAKVFKHIDYVFFRRFKENEGKHIRSSQIAAYVVDNSAQRLTENELADLHHKLWLHGAAPLIYVAWPTRIDILTCARKADFWIDSSNNGVARYRSAERIENPQNGAQSIKTAARIAGALDGLRKRFSAFRLAEGTFWDDPENQKLAKSDAAAHRTLIQAIVEADRKLGGANHPIRRRLLVLMILIKYLEDRAVFPSEHFHRFRAGARSFGDILRDGTVEQLLKLLRHLENKFNGDVFSLGSDASKLTAAEMRHFAKFVDAKELSGQQYFWKLFSFEYIPVEVISRLYQRFVTGHGAVYTPPFLASLLLDQVMPYEGMTGNERILDPACGSGIFLVGAFKRLVIHWRSQKNWRKPTAEKLKQLLARSIHGVELESGAVDLTAFSLALAVCDALEPPVIWSSLKFDKLRDRNLREGDFFDSATFANTANHNWPEKFDVIIGNPPFESRLTPAATTADNARPPDQPKLPDKQAAYLFLEHGLRLLVAGGSLCLIQPHGLLYNGKTYTFRQHLMKLCRLHSVLDFVSMRGLYDGADPKTIAWHAVQKPLIDHPVLHLTFRRTYTASERIAFELDHYDYHRISAHDAFGNPVIWRCSLLGGGRLVEISGRLRRLKKLEEVIAERHWIYSEGFNVGNGAQYCKYLTDQPYLPTKGLTESGIDNAHITKLTERRFEAPRVKELYDPPLILIKENVSLPVAFWNSSNLTYRHSIVGIHAPKNEEQMLQDFYREISKHRRLYRLCFLLIGARTLTGKATAINKQDIDQLPFPDDLSELELAFWEDVLKEDVLNYMADYVRLGQDSNLLKKPAKASDVTLYSSLYVRMLGSLYSNLKAHEPIFLNGLIAQPFYFGAKPDVSWLGNECEESLHQMIYDNSRESLRTVRVVRHYEGNVILIVKPDRLRYWIRSTAIRDADDTLINLREQGW